MSRNALGTKALGVGLLFVIAVGAQSPNGSQMSVLPISASELKDIRDRQDLPGMRGHAWGVFSEITQPSMPGDQSSPPVWDTWEDRAELFSGQVQRSVDHTRERDIRLPLEVLASISQRVENQDAAVKEAVRYIKERGVGPEVLYSPSAASHIRSNKLYDPQVLQARWKTLSDLNSPIGETSIPEFPDSSIVVKALWLTVGPINPEVLRVWDPPDNSRLNCEYGCERQIKVQLAGPNQACNLPLQGTTPVLSSCFYSVPDPSTQGYRLILFGLHVATKEMEDWTWSTFWWQDEPGKGEYAYGRPDARALQGYWRNYVMDTTLSMVTPEERSARPTTVPAGQRCLAKVSQTAKICFNPYLELAMKPNGDKSNCMNCHRQATFPALDPDPRGSPQRGYLSSDDACFGRQKVGDITKERVVKVDYLWSLSPIDPQSKFGQFLVAVQNQLKLSAK